MIHGPLIDEERKKELKEDLKSALEIAVSTVSLLTFFFCVDYGLKESAKMLTPHKYLPGSNAVVTTIAYDRDMNGIPEIVRTTGKGWKGFHLTTSERKPTQEEIDWYKTH